MLKNSCKINKVNNIYFKIFLVLLILSIGIFLRIFPIKNFFGLTSNNFEKDQHLSIEKNVNQNVINNIVMDFYNNLNQGDYNKSFENAIELVWEKDIYFDKNKNVGNNKVIGIKKTQNLINRTVKELGNNGEKLSIYDTKVLDIIKINNKKDYNNLQDIKIIDKVSEFKEIENIYIVSVEGQLIYCTFCSRSKWDKDLVLIKFKDESDIKILLNGAKNMADNCSMEWFINRVVGEYIKI